MDATPQYDPIKGWPEGEVATATDFVRHFGHYAATSRSKPIYIAQHGRVGWALLSAAEMTRLSGTNNVDTSTDARFDILADSISTLVVIIDRDFRIIRMNSAAHRHFQISESATSPTSFVVMLKDSHRELIADTCNRVLQSGDTEAFELESTRYPGRKLYYQISVFPGGLLVLADVVSASTHTRKQLAASIANEMAIDAVSSLGRGRIDARETITSLNQSLITIAGGSRDEMIGLRLWELFEPKSRNQIRDALDRLFTTGQPILAEGKILTTSGNDVPVTIGIGPEREMASITGAAFVITPQSSPV